MIDNDLTETLCLIPTDPALQIYEFEKEMEKLRGLSYPPKSPFLHCIYALDHPDHVFSQALTELVPVLLDKLDDH